jgi:hypothetical protein
VYQLEEVWAQDHMLGEALLRKERLSGFLEPSEIYMA